MGSQEGEQDRDDYDEGPQHRVEITKGFYIGSTEVTQGQWKAVTGTEPWKHRDACPEGNDYPATFVSWDDAVAFCRMLSQQEGKTYRLPWEAEWEYACRGGTTTRFCFGDDKDALGEYAWWGALYGGSAKDEPYPHRVAQKKPNQFGLYDMHGNIAEWCGDWYHHEFYKSSPLRDPHGPTSGSARVLKGGSNASPLGSVRCATRDGNTPDTPNDGYGFRVVLE
jgi:formylglycine-generating enzyme required for sulfatase activity